MVFVRAILPNEAVCWSPPPKVPVTYLSLKMSSSYCSGFWLCDYCLGTISMGCRISTASCWNRYSSVVGGGPSSTSFSAPYATASPSDCLSIDIGLTGNLLASWPPSSSSDYSYSGAIISSDGCCYYYIFKLRYRAFN